nr:hypothetical protein [Tanacetum cinerariifolium]
EPEQAPLSPDYVPGPKELEQEPSSPVYLPYVPELVYPEYMPPEDDVFPGDPKEDDEEDPEEDPVDYPADSTIVALPAIDHVPSKEETEPLPQIPPPPLHITSPPTNSPTHIEIPESCLLLRKRLRFASPTPNKEVRESSTADATRRDEPTVARDDPYSLVREEIYGFVDRDELVGAIEEIAQPPYRGSIRGLPIFLPLLSKRLPSCMREREARMAHEAWGLSMDASDNARLDVMSLRTTLVAQHALILDLQAADRKRQGVIKELLAADHKRHV